MHTINQHPDKDYDIDVGIIFKRDDLKGSNGADKTALQELASSEWKESDPESITNWYNNAVIEQSPDNNNGRQMRRVTRLTKKWSNSRSSWNMPSGFMTSVLIDEEYFDKLNRDDEALYETLKAIIDRLSWNKNLYNPITRESISEGKEHLLKNMYNELDKALNNTLNILEDDDCTYEQAMKAWSKFFNDDFFKNKIKKSEEYRSISDGAKPWLQS